MSDSFRSRLARRQRQNVSGNMYSVRRWRRKNEWSGDHRVVTRPTGFCKSVRGSQPPYRYWWSIVFARVPNLSGIVCIRWPLMSRNIRKCCPRVGLLTSCFPNKTNFVQSRPLISDHRRHRCIARALIVVVINGAVNGPITLSFNATILKAVEEMSRLRLYPSKRCPRSHYAAPSPKKILYNNEQKLYFSG